MTTHISGADVTKVIRSALDLRRRSSLLSKEAADAAETQWGWRIKLGQSQYVSGEAEGMINTLKLLGVDQKVISQVIDRLEENA